jgi:hypothetical protein
VLSRAVGLLLAVADAVVESYEPARFPALPCAGPNVRYYVMVHFGDVHTKRCARGLVGSLPFSTPTDARWPIALES